MSGFEENFKFTRKERRGILVFTILLSMIASVSYFWPDVNPKAYPSLEAFYIPKDSIPDFEEADESNDWFASSKRSFPDYNQKSRPKQKFIFNPEKISIDSLLLLGFSKFNSVSIAKYISKGGKIRTIQKLKSMYGIDTNLVNVLKPYIVFTKDDPRDLKYPTVYKPFDYERIIVDINTSDSADWIKISGIAPMTAGKIMRFKRRSGGFSDINQLVEYNLLKDSLFQLIKDQFTVDAKDIVRTDLNKADYKMLISHPIMTPALVKSILNYKKQHGDFKSVIAIRKIISIKEEDGERIIPFLKVESN